MSQGLLWGGYWTVACLVVLALLFAYAWVFEKRADYWANRADLDRRRSERPSMYRTNRGRLIPMDELRAQARCHPSPRLETRGTVRGPYFDPPAAPAPPDLDAEHQDYLDRQDRLSDYGGEAA